MSVAVREAALTAGYPPGVADWLAAGTRPAARLVPELSADVVVPGQSKIGGLADLAASSEWPRGEHGPMTFCGQVAIQDVEFLRGVDGWWPRPGLLLFFADKDPDGDNVEAGKVLFEDASVERRDAPGDLHPHSRFDEAPARAVPALTPPSIDLIADGDGDLDHSALYKTLRRSP